MPEMSSPATTHSPPAILTLRAVANAKSRRVNRESVLRSRRFSANRGNAKHYVVVAARRTRIPAMRRDGAAARRAASLCRDESDFPWNPGNNRLSRDETF
ncbi:unnamed protein product [Lasius platythorax]|uniref:Uncharacterized protein n=1 Tax=Lasius platythorax TaxID=488582 RepID=A0AAV2NP65_9HYME